MQHLATLAKYTRSLVNTFSANYHVTQKPFLNITEKQLADTHFMNDLLKTPIPKHSRRSQRGLFHGKETKSGNRYSEMGNAVRRFWKPNTFEKTLRSEILGKSLTIQISTKAMRCIRKYGGFDNYILLTKPKNMDSLYGEYLRTLMMKKLTNPSYKIPYITRSQPFEGNNSRHRYRIRRRPTVFHPKDQRYTDLTKDRVKIPDEMTKEELRVFYEFDALNNSHKDTQTNHPLVKAYQEENEREMKLLEADSLKMEAEKAESRERHRNNVNLHKLKKAAAAANKGRRRRQR